MRYHWGLGVGHLHAHQTSAAPNNKPGMSQAEDVQADEPPDCIPADLEVPSENRVDAQLPDGGDDDMYDSDCPELGLDDRQLEGWEDVDSDDDLELDDAEFEEGFDDEDMDDDEEDFTGL
jgi:hypothetical protein